MKESKSKEKKNKDFKKEIEEQSKVLKELIEKSHLQKNINEENIPNIEKEDKYISNN